MNSGIVHEFPPLFRVYKSGRVEKYRWPPKKTPPFDDPITGVRSKDVVISTDPHVSARIFLPRLPDPIHKLPVLLYIHGGGFVLDSAFSPVYHRHVSALSSGANVLAISVEYRLAPENPIPACYDDCWAAFRWIAAHAEGAGPDPWLNDYADLSHVFVGGDSAGGNISHNIGVWAGSARLPGVTLSGLVLVHPVFSGPGFQKEAWKYLFPTGSGSNDRRIKPPSEDLAKIFCGRVLVCLAEKDVFSAIGRCYYENLKASGWKGTAELVESQGEDHCFHLVEPNSDKALDLVRKIVCFVKQGCLVSSL